MSVIPEGSVPGTGRELRAYRVMIIGADSTVKQIIPLPADSDDAAKAAARRLAREGTADLWDGLRFIERYEARPCD